MPSSNVAVRAFVERTCCFAVICWFAVASASAQLPATRLYAVLPPGAKQGTQVDVTLTSGADLEGVSRLYFSHPGITAVQKTQMVEGKEEPQPVANQFQVNVAPDVPPGIYEVRAIGTYGISSARSFVVGDRPESAETEPNNALEQATEVPLGSIVNGAINGGADTDFFKFTAQAGQRIIIDCYAQRIDSRLDPTLELFDTSGRQLDFNRDFNGRDAFLDFTVPADGTYVIQLYDFEHGGSTEYVYRLSIGETPHIDFILPPSGLAGSTGQYTIYGRNLPAGTPAEGVTIDGKALERMTVDISLPGDPLEAQRIQCDTLIDASELALDGIDYRLSTPQGVSNSVLISMATAPVVQELEPNDEPAAAQHVDVPVEVTGQFQCKGDVDLYSFTAKKGDVLWIEVFSQRLGVYSDPLFIVQQVTTNDKGEESVKELNATDDATANIGGFGLNTATGDPIFRFAAPDDGTYRVIVRDLYHESNGDPQLVYRLSLRGEQPDFRLAAVAEFPINAAQNPQPWSTLLRKGGTDMIHVMAIRRDNFNGEIDLTVEGLPEGVTCDGATIGPGLTSTKLVLVAAEGAADWAGPIRIVGKAKIGDAEVVREARGASVTWAANARNAPNRLTRDFAVAVSQTAPYLVQAGINRVELPQSRLLEIPLTVTRREEFAEALALTAVGIPGKIANDAVNIAGDKNDGTLRLFVQPDAPVGTYSFYVQSTSKVKFTKKPDGSDKKDVAVVDASTPITFTITPGPVVLAAKVPNKGALKVGEKMEVPVQVTRRNEFAGPVTLNLSLPSRIAGVSAAAVTVPADQNQGTLVIEAAADATVGDHKYVCVSGTLESAGAQVVIDQVIPLNIQK